MLLLLLLMVIGGCATVVVIVVVAVAVTVAVFGRFLHFHHHPRWFQPSTLPQLFHTYKHTCTEIQFVLFFSGYLFISGCVRVCAFLCSWSLFSFFFRYLSFFLYCFMYSFELYLLLFACIISSSFKKFLLLFFLNCNASACNIDCLHVTPFASFSAAAYPKRKPITIFHSAVSSYSLNSFIGSWYMYKCLCI